MSEYRRRLAYEAGKKAALSGKPESANNRQPGTIFFDDWCDGWANVNSPSVELGFRNGNRAA
jgi:hypothetical protein